MFIFSVLRKSHVLTSPSTVKGISVRTVAMSEILFAHLLYIFILNYVVIKTQNDHRAHTLTRYTWTDGRSLLIGRIQIYRASTTIKNKRKAFAMN